MHRLITVSGPAGSGKTTLCQRLLLEFPQEVSRVITTTTRPPREGEQDGIDYYFYTQQAFEAGIAAGAFYEYARVHGRYYGTLKREVRDKLAAGKHLLLNIDVQGAASFREAAQADPLLQGRLVQVFIRITEAQLRERLSGRGDDDAQEIERRLASARKELSQAHAFDHVIDSADREHDYAWFRRLFLQGQDELSAG